MSLVDFKCMEYRNGKVIANKVTQERIAKFSERQIEEATGLDRKTIRLIRRGKEPVKPITLSKIIKFLDTENVKNERENYKLSPQLIANGSVLYSESEGVG